MGSKNSSRRFSFSDFINQSLLKVFNTIKRFPLTAIFLFALASILIYLNEISYLSTIEEPLQRLAGTLVFAVACSLFFSAIREKYGENLTVFATIINYLVQIAFVFLFYQFVYINTEMVAVLTLWLTVAALLIAFVFIPYISKKGIEIYITKLINKAAVSVFFMLCITLGVIAVFAGIKALLINDLNTDLYYYTFIIAAVIFAPLNFLANLPYKAQKYKLKDFNWLLKVAFTYIALPLLSIYTVILYLYFGKVLITTTWPSGIVSYLVVTYAAIGIASIFILSPYKDKNRWVGGFSVIYSKAVFPLLAMMFYAIIVRINQYGFTENRYFVLIIGIWATLVMLYVNFNKGKRNIVFLISLALTLLVCAYGPLSAFNISINSQNKRFNSILNEYNMIQNQTIVASSNVSDNHKREISNILYYFNDNHDFSQLKILPKDFKFKDMETLFGFKEYYNIPHTKSNNFYYNRGDEILDISGYQLLFDFYLDNYSNKDIDGFIVNNEEYNISFNDNMLVISKNNEELISVNLKDYATTLYKKYKLKYKGNFTANQLSFKTENDAIEIKFYFNQFNGYVDEANDIVNFSNAQGKMLIKLK
ncbi:DUF4153 domain-containing protein [Clostridium sp. 'deep sea']|uniref:DUF4153 domain-containing protein n=1 Tax=Clostridium sp. 'deep sea' TaxID=2779445 RepID=UPI0018964703|nr:DUF4153 domain-containing protein [Clostridium sp. 'deep sea']QOR34202.1 DUF4153 domain-containing protein [Clostridium sp. 'deep sea']